MAANEPMGWLVLSKCRPLIPPSVMLPRLGKISTTQVTLIAERCIPSSVGNCINGGSACVERPLVKRRVSLSGVWSGWREHGRVEQTGLGRDQLSCQKLPAASGMVCCSRLR